ncbi:hypothetical protein EXU18_28635 [Klebsiella pneumoniae]|nr:hypothetical protein EXT87_28600 [Klebsiella pneumoniae]TBO64126.1 hypothetical protein EXT85_26330 [Klebsiella quasipneumoniae subsp. similipneumoniae]TBO75758.1 hypothetical protein EXT98_28675 [Klebsiella pneumoniae]TBO79370.1 hypothetical protein EXT88_26695 [Klebsiella quasipneumoniae subsp. similipneumoniae]TBO82705.1 hypothetical protein EXU03_28490 [Klebsiella quasipneumoniae subsp. similipneumoniae]
MNKTKGCLIANFATVPGGLSALSVPLCLKAHFCQAEIYNLRGHVSKNGKADSILTKRRGPA